MRIGVFVYGFPHRKSVDGLINLMVNGYAKDIKIVVGAPKIKLNIAPTIVRVGPKDLVHQHPEVICDLANLVYVQQRHNDDLTVEMLKHLNLDLGIVLGARILRPELIDAFSVGILNLHPAILPWNRGLDNIKYAVWADGKQGVTTHLIDAKVDRGLLVERSEIAVYPDDTFLDIYLRIASREQELLISSLLMLQGELAPLTPLGAGPYESTPLDREDLLPEMFEMYKKEYDKCPLLVK